MELVFVYDKKDDHASKSAILDFVSCSFIEKERTGDFTTTFRLREMIDDGANEEDVWAYLNDAYFPGEAEELMDLAEVILKNPPKVGCFRKIRSPRFCVLQVEEN